MFAKLEDTKSQRSESLDGKISNSAQAASEISASSDGHGDDVWMGLCGQAAVEQDPKRLLELVREINRLLEVRKQRLSGAGLSQPGAPSSQLKND